MVNLKRNSLRVASLEAALDKAHHYCLLNEPLLAESICLTLEVESNNQRALITPLLAYRISSQLRQQEARQQAEDLIPRLASEYDRYYYEGIIHERWACLLFESGMAPNSITEWLGKAMKCFEMAE
ncbi:MAG: hypothetical protein R3C09_18680 [Pirellulaceae bacterium]